MEVFRSGGVATKLSTAKQIVTRSHINLVFILALEVIVRATPVRTVTSPAKTSSIDTLNSIA